MSKSCRTFDSSILYWEMERLSLLYFSTKAPFEFSTGFADAWADAGNSLPWQVVGHYLGSQPRRWCEWNFPARALPVSCCWWSTALPRHQGSQCHPVPWSTAQGHGKPYTVSLRNLCCLSIVMQRLPPSERRDPGFCPLLAPGFQSRSLGISCSSVQVTLLVLCVKTMQYARKEHTRPYLCSCSEGKHGYLGHDTEQRQMESFCVLTKLSWRGKKQEPKGHLGYRESFNLQTDNEENQGQGWRK